MTESLALEPEEQLADCELEAPGWHQLQKAAVPWLLSQVRAKRLKPRDLSAWLAVAGAAELKTGEARVTCTGLARDFSYTHWSHVASSFQRLQQIGALQRVAPGRYMVSPRLLRVGGPGRHHQWFCRWEELQVERERTQPAPVSRATGAAGDRWLARQLRLAQPA